MKFEFTAREYLAHLRQWIFGFPVPTNVFDHLIIGLAGGDAAECLTCGAKFKEDDKCQMIRISDTEFVALSKKDVRAQNRVAKRRTKK